MRPNALTAVKQSEIQADFWSFKLIKIKKLHVHVKISMLYKSHVSGRG